MNNLVDQIYVINMKKDVERLDRFKNQIGNLFKYTLVKGVDPINDEKYKEKYNNWKLKNNIIITYDNFNWKYYIQRYTDLNIMKTKEEAWEHWINYGEKELRSCNPNNNIVNAGQWGCLHSHINIIKNAIQQNYNSIIILEDDIILTQDIHSKINKLREFIELHNNWNIIYLGASQHNWSDISFGINYYNAKNTTGTFAYMINNNFYRILLNEFSKMTKPVDNYLVDIQKRFYGSIYVIYPNIIKCDLEESNIGEKRENIEYYKIFRWNIN